MPAAEAHIEAATNPVQHNEHLNLVTVHSEGSQQTSKPAATGHPAPGHDTTTAHLPHVQIGGGDATSVFLNGAGGEVTKHPQNLLHAAEYGAAAGLLTGAAGGAALAAGVVALPELAVGAAVVGTAAVIGGGIYGAMHAKDIVNTIDTVNHPQGHSPQEVAKARQAMAHAGALATDVTAGVGSAVVGVAAGAYAGIVGVENAAYDFWVSGG